MAKCPKIAHDLVNMITISFANNKTIQGVQYQKLKMNLISCGNDEELYKWCIMYSDVNAAPRFPLEKSLDLPIQLSKTALELS